MMMKTEHTTELFYCHYTSQPVLASILFNDGRFCWDIMASLPRD